MVQREVTVRIRDGFHARPATLLVVQAAKSKSKVTILFNGKTINAKSMFHILGGAICMGSRLIMTADGSDEHETLETMCHLVENLLE